MQREPLINKTVLHEEAETSPKPISRPAVRGGQRVPFSAILSTERPTQLVSLYLVVFLPPSAGPSGTSAVVGMDRGGPVLAQLWSEGWEKADQHVGWRRCGAHPGHSEMLWSDVCVIQDGKAGIKAMPCSQLKQRAKRMQTKQ